MLPMGLSRTPQASVILCSDFNLETLEQTWGEETLKLTEIFVDLEAQALESLVLDLAFLLSTI